MTNKQPTPREIPPQHAGIEAYAYPDLWEYHRAIGGDGSHAYTWKDKPHRLVYDLTRMVALTRRALADMTLKHQVACDTIARQRADNERLSGYIHATDSSKDRVIAGLRAELAGVVERCAKVAESMRVEYPITGSLYDGRVEDAIRALADLPAAPKAEPDEKEIF